MPPKEYGTRRKHNKKASFTTVQVANVGSTIRKDNFLEKKQREQVGRGLRGGRGAGGLAGHALMLLDAVVQLLEHFNTICKAM